MCKDSTDYKPHQLKDVVRKANLFERLAKGEDHQSETIVKDKEFIGLLSVKDRAKNFINSESQNVSKATVKDKEFIKVSVKDKINEFSNKDERKTHSKTTVKDKEFIKVSVKDKINKFIKVDSRATSKATVNTELSGVSVKANIDKFSKVDSKTTSKTTVNNEFSGVSVKANIDKFSKVDGKTTSKTTVNNECSEASVNAKIKNFNNIERENIKNQSIFKPANTTSLLNSNTQKNIPNEIEKTYQTNSSFKNYDSVNKQETREGVMDNSRAPAIDQNEARAAKESVNRFLDTLSKFENKPVERRENKIKYGNFFNQLNKKLSNDENEIFHAKPVQLS